MNDKKREKNIISDLSDKPLNELLPDNQLAVLLVYLLEYFEAGGLTDDESIEIFDLFLECIGNMKEESHGMLVDRIIEKWTLPLMKTKGNC